MLLKPAKKCFNKIYYIKVTRNKYFNIYIKFDDLILITF